MESARMERYTASVERRTACPEGSREMMSSSDMTKRQLREGVEFFRFLRAHEA
jgi:hypothetical protein